MSVSIPLDAKTARCGKQRCTGMSADHEMPRQAAQAHIAQTEANLTLSHSRPTMDRNRGQKRQNVQKNSQYRPRRLSVPLSLAGLLLIAACGRAPTDVVLRGGVPAMTDLHRASTLPSELVRTVARRDFGWRLIYHPTRAPVNAEQDAARALCGLEKRRPAQIDRVPRVDPYADPGAAIIDIYCA